MQFVDTNGLLYAVSRVPDEVGKRDVAREILQQTNLAISVQVLQEFFHQATRPRRTGMTRANALAFLAPFLSKPVQSMTPAVFLDAVDVAQRYQVSYWDGAILAAARAQDCDVVYTEDLNHGQDYGGVRAVNPFTERTADA